MIDKMQITKYNPYTPTQQLALEASQGKKIKNLKTSEYISKVKEAIIQGLIYLGQKQDSTQIATLTEILCYELKTSYKYLTVEEVKIAIEFGAKGKLCEVTSLTQPVISATNIIKFLNLYNQHIRREAIAAHNSEQEKREKEISEREREKKIKEFEKEIESALKLSFEEKTKIPVGLKSAYYRHLDKSGRVTLSVEEKKIIYDKAVELYNNNNNNEHRNPFFDIIFEAKKKQAQIIELAQALAFELL